MRRIGIRSCPRLFDKPNLPHEEPALNGLFTLETPRLMIRPLQTTDLNDVQRIVNDGFGASPLEQHCDWLDWTTRNYTALSRLYQPPYGDRGIVLKATGALIGLVGFVPAFGPFDTLSGFRAQLTEAPSGLFTPEFGLYWVVDSGQRGSGYATEAARAMVDHAFTALHLKRIVATTEYDNHASQGVMRNLGMTLERNPYTDPPWFQIIGILANPRPAEPATPPTTITLTQEN